MHSFRRRIAAIAVAAPAVLAACGGDTVPVDATSAPPAAGAVALRVLSNRADLVSGDDVLVEVTLPAGTPASAVALSANGSPAQAAGGLDRAGRYVARIGNLARGQNVLRADVRGSGASATIVNHPNGGPIFFGPQIEPWRCQDGAVDADCNQPPVYTWLYKSSDPTVPGLQPYDPAHPPDDVATTTTDEGVAVPFIVRQELGYQDRDQYRILTLFRPGEPWEPWAPQQQWNRKVLVPHGGNCGSDHGAGGAPLEDYAGTFGDAGLPGVENSYITALGRGFAVMSTALDNLGHNCNVVLAAESLLMAKERLIEQYGPIRYTIGTGCSGGSITQMMVANAYPGIYQGSITTCAYADVLSTGTQFAELHMMRRYFEPSQSDGSLQWGDGIAWTPDQMAAVEGHISHLNAITSDELFFKAVTAPTGDCAGPDSYHPTNNPGGKRCGLMDFLVNILGTRGPEVWSPMEVAAGKGFAGNPIDNEGVQYGLGALRLGRITPAQFVDLNAKIGGLDIDIQHQPARTVADRPALGHSYRSGELNSVHQLNRTAIINAVGPDPGAAHDTVHAYWTRWRLDRVHGNHDNHVMWAGPAPLIGDPNYMNQALIAMDRWLAAVEADARAVPLAQKLTDNKPADVHDQCSDGAGHKVADEVCVELVTPAIAYSTPRTVPGGPRENDILKCQLKPLSRDDDYGLVPFTDAQWAQLEEIFATGVCDFSRPGVDQQATVSWLTYGDAQNVIYGGTPLPPPPPGSGAGWASPAFGVFGE